MAGLPRSIIKKYGVSKKAWAVFRGSKPRSKSKRVRGVRMARKGKKRSFGGGLTSLFMPVAIGAVAGAFSDKIPGVSALPPVAAGAAGGYIAKRNMMGAAAGAAGAYFLAAPLKQMISGTSSTTAW